MQRKILKIKNIKEILDNQNKEVYFKVRKREGNKEWLEINQVITKKKHDDEITEQLNKLTIGEQQTDDKIFAKKVDYQQMMKEGQERYQNQIRKEKREQKLWNKRQEYLQNEELKDIVIFAENDKTDGHEFEYYKVEQKQSNIQVDGIINIDDYEEYLDKYEFLEDKQIMQVYEEEDSNSEDYYANDYPEEEEEESEDNQQEYSEGGSSQSSMDLNRFRKEFEEAIKKNKKSCQIMDVSF